MKFGRIVSKSERFVNQGETGASGGQGEALPLLASSPLKGLSPLRIPWSVPLCGTGGERSICPPGGVREPQPSDCQTAADDMRVSSGSLAKQGFLTPFATVQAEGE